MFFAFRCLQGLLVVLLATVSPSKASDTLRVFVSIEPLQYLVEKVGSDRVESTVVVQGTQRPETYEPTPRQLAALAGADAFFGVGMPLEDAWRGQLDAKGAPSPAWVDLSAGLARAEQTVDAGSHRHGEMDPHVWLSPAHARQMTATIRDALTRLDPGGGAHYGQNAEALDRALESLDREIEQILADSGVDAFLVFHPAWGHFARAYGLEQIAIESEGKEPGPRAMIEVINRAKEAGIRTVFVDARHATRLARTVAGAIGANVEMLDPLAADYPNNLRKAARAIAESGSHE